MSFTILFAKEDVPFHLTFKAVTFTVRAIFFTANYTIIQRVVSWFNQLSGFCLCCVTRNESELWFRLIPSGVFECSNFISFSLPIHSLFISMSLGTEFKKPTFLDLFFKFKLISDMVDNVTIWGIIVLFC